jgi:hypothetical protein
MPQHKTSEYTQPTPESIAAEFERWNNNRRGVSRLYEVIVEEIIQDRELLLLVTEAGSLKFIPNRFMASVHFLLLEGKQDSLARYYSTVSDSPILDSDAHQHFRSFCFRYKNELLRLMRNREVQINEVRRCAALLPALTLIWERNHYKPMALLDVGACAGLNMIFDQYFYDYGPAIAIGSLDAPVKIKCTPLGPTLPPLRGDFPRVVWRLGIDRKPINVRDTHAVNWLIANVSPDDTQRLTTLQAALALARTNPPEIIEGSAHDVLTDALARIPEGLLVCVFHSFAIQDFNEQELLSFYSDFSDFGRNRALHVISLEWENIGGQLQKERRIPLKITSIENGHEEHETVASIDIRGECKDLEWVSPMP